MAIDAFLDFTKSKPAIKGESTDDQLKDTMHISDFSFGIAQKGTATTGTGLGAGKAEFEDFEFTKSTDLASSMLLKHCAAGTHFNEVFLRVRKAGGTQQEFLTYKFVNVLISSFSTSGDEESVDKVKFNYQAVLMTYKPQDSATGKVAASGVSGGWDLKTNKELTA